jgi:beta-phosphoglucomutase-like phosphatase (HAD superfamily)
MLDTEPARAVVVEDAISGVQAGKAGNFGLVIGVDRHGEPDSLKNNGADIVVDDLDKLLPT